MADLASSNRAELSIAEETTAGVKQPLFYDTAVVQRMTGETLNYNLTYTNSEEIRSDRQLSDLVQTQASVSGDQSVEWSAKSFDPLLQSVMGEVYNAFTAAYVPADAVAATDSTMTSAGTAFVITNLVLGQWIKLDLGTVQPLNNKFVQLSKTVAATTGTLTFEGTPLTTATIDVDLQITESEVLRVGTTEKSFTIVKTLNDTVPVTYFTYIGMRVTKLSLNFSVGSILTGTFSFLGESAEVDTTIPTGTPGNETAASTTDVMNSVSDIANIWLDDVISTSFFNNLTLDIDGALREQQAIGTLGSIGIAQGRFLIGGSISIYFEDKALYEKYVNATAFSIAFSVEDAAGNAYIFTMGKCKFESNTTNASGNDTDVMMDGTYKALLDSVTTTLQIDKFEVA